MCLQLDYVPLWLAKISITPNMKENSPELVEKLIKYQLKAKDALAAAFLPQTAKPVKRKRIVKKEKVALYIGTHSSVLVIGDEMYDLETNECEDLNVLVPKLIEMNVNQIPDVVKAYLSLHDSSPKMECSWSVECDS